MCKNILLVLVLCAISFCAQAAADANEAESDESNKTSVKADEGKVSSEDLGQFGFGPAFFVISYGKEVLKDSKDVRVRSDGLIDSSGSQYSTAIGLEVHYDFSFPADQYGYPDENGNIIWEPTSGYIVSPFLGVYDFENGINGLAAGVLFGYWKGDINYKNKKSLNVGLGYTIHKDQLVLAKGVSESVAPPSGLQPIDYTTREDVEGLILMISVSVGF